MTTPAHQAAARIREALEAGATSAWITHPRDCNMWRENEMLAQACEPSNLRALLAERDELSNEVHDVRAAFEGSRAIIAALKAERDELAKDAARYRWLRNEAWGGGMAKRKFPHVVEYRPGLMPTAVLELAEEALDAAIDAALTNKD